MEAGAGRRAKSPAFSARKVRPPDLARGRGGEKRKLEASVSVVSPVLLPHGCVFPRHRRGGPCPPPSGGDGGEAKGDVTAMSAACMCLFAPENETLVSLQPPGHV